MIGVFDSGIGGLTIFRALVERFPNITFVYLGDHANVPYGDRASDDIVALTRRGVDALFRHGCRLVLLGCNTATCIAARTLQQGWLPVSGWPGRKILGIVAPTVEAATQTPWAVTTPQYPQKYNTDTIAVFGTTRTIASHAYPEEIRKRCPKVMVVQQTCPELAAAIELGMSEETLDALVKQGVGALRRRPAAHRRTGRSWVARTIRWSSTCSATICLPSRGCCRSPRWWPTAWRTTCSAIRATSTALLVAMPASPSC
jgi:glutamate racemase